MTKTVSLRALAPAAVLAIAALGAANCSDSNNALCTTAGSTQVGVFNTVLTFNAADTSQCYYGDGGSAPDASLAATTAPFTSAICSGFDPYDGGPTLYFALPAYVRGSTIGAGGTFNFASTSAVSGTTCGCTIDVAEQISFTLTPEITGTPIAINADGGLTPISGFTGIVVDQISVDDGGVDAGDTDAGCLCNLPCDLQYMIQGTAF